MPGEQQGSVTGWIRDLRGDAAAAASRALWGRYFEWLAALARSRLGPGPRGATDAEDVALSVFDSFFRGVVSGRFPDLDDREGLWRLLVTITNRKALNRRRDEARQKRGGGKVIDEAALLGPRAEEDELLAQVVGDEPTPKEAASVTEEYRRLFGMLSDESLRVVALLKLEGHSNEEIARSLDCGLRTVERKLELIRKRWAPEADS
jgi:DNA-directed RNA polymerase specialized sigma24 family protein